MLKMKTKAGKSQGISKQPQEKGLSEKRAVGYRPWDPSGQGTHCRGARPEEPEFPTR